MTTLADQIEREGGHTTGFDYLRLLLAIGVIVWHVIVTTYGPIAQDNFQAGPLRPLQALIVPMFFALSGFLVAGSLLRCKTLLMFVGLRGIRIFPALTVEVILSALLIGPLITSSTLRNYFSSAEFWRYFLNIPGIIHYHLPGVFENNPNPRTVNGQLWTIPFELYCYIAITGMALVLMHRNPAVFLAVTVALTFAGSYLYFRKYGLNFERRPTGVPGFALVSCFLFGAWLYLARVRVPWRADLFVICAVLTGAGLSIPPIGDLVAIVPMTYMTVYLGLCNPRKIWFLRGADYSYGLFLYGYVIQQAWMSIGPSVREWYWNLLLALPTAAIVSALSWHLIEKPALGWRKHLASLEEWWLRRRPSVFRMASRGG